MSQSQFNWRMLGWPVYLALALFVIVVGVFVVGLVTLSAVPSASTTITPLLTPTALPVSTASANDARVTALLAIGKAVDGESVINQYGCHVCHTAQVAGVGPSWVGIAARAATRRPPMSAAAYLYQSITDPSAYVVAGYPNVMPGDFAKRMSDQKLADVIAYLLTPNAR